MTLLSMFFDAGIPWVLVISSWRIIAIVIAVIGLLLAILCAVFIQQNPHKKQKRQILPLKKYGYNLFATIKSRQFLWILLITIFTFVPITIIGALWGINFLRDVYHLQEKVAGYVVAAIFLGSAFGAPILSVLSDRWGKHKWIIGICFIIEIIAALFLIYLPLGKIIWPAVMLFIIGFCSGTNPILFSLNKRLFPNKLAGSAFAITNFCSLIPGMIFQTLVGYVLNAFWQGQKLHGLRHYPHLAYEVAFAVIPILLLVGVCLVPLLKVAEQHKA